MLDGTQGRRARAAAVAADQHDVGMGFGHTGGHRAHAHLRHQLHGNASARIDVLQVVDQLRQILNGINIVMRRWRNQTNPGSRMPQASDHFIYFVPGKLAALSRLRALRHFDLQLVGVHQVIRSDAKARRRYLLDGGTPRIAVGVGNETLFIFAAFAGVRLSADPVHGDGQRFVSFFADRTE